MVALWQEADGPSLVAMLPVSAPVLAVVFNCILDVYGGNLFKVNVTMLHF